MFSAGEPVVVSDEAIRRLSHVMCSSHIVRFAREHLKISELDVDRATHEPGNNKYEYVFQGLLAWHKAKPEATIKELLQICEQHLCDRAGSNKHLTLLRQIEENQITTKVLSELSQSLDYRLAEPLIDYLGTQHDATANMPISPQPLEVKTSKLLKAWKNAEGENATICELRQAVNRSKFYDAPHHQKVMDALSDEEKRAKDETIRSLRHELETATAREKEKEDNFHNSLKENNQQLQKQMEDYKKEIDNSFSCALQRAEADLHSKMHNLQQQYKSLQSQLTEAQAEIKRLEKKMDCYHAPPKTLLLSISKNNKLQTLNLSQLRPTTVNLDISAHPLLHLSAGDVTQNCANQNIPVHPTWQTIADVNVPDWFDVSYSACYLQKSDQLIVNGPESKCCILDLSAKRLIALPDIDTLASLRNVGVCSVGNECVYVLGGYDTQTHSHSDSVYRMVRSRNIACVWEKLHTRIPVAVDDPIVVCVDDSLYCLGGDDGLDSRSTHVQIYTPGTNQWLSGREVGSGGAPEPLAGGFHGAVVVGDTIHVLTEKHHHTYTTTHNTWCTATHGVPRVYKVVPVCVGGGGGLVVLCVLHRNKTHAMYLYNLHTHEHTETHTNMDALSAPRLCFSL